MKKLLLINSVLLCFLMGIYLYTSDGSIASGLIVANSDFSKLEKKLYSGAKKTELSKPLPADYNYSFVYGEVVKLIKDNYVEEVEQQKFFDSALNGMLTSLDPHSSYFPKDEYNQLLADTEGEFSGIGIEVMMENQMVKVVTPIDDTPAFNAGIKSGDYIAYINDKPVVGLTLIECVRMMRGKDSKDREIVKLIVLRKGEKEPLEIKVKRDLIKTKSVKARREGDIIYLRIASFTSQTYNEMIKEFNIVENDIGKKNVKGLVLDLRNNPGGLLDSSILISDAFLDKGKKIVSIRGKEDSLVREYFDKEEQDLIPNIPMVVLINEGSASASEIVSGALQDHKRAIILGTKSFGKGSVQSLIPLNNGGAIKLTVAKYYTPNDVSIQAKGIIPDIEVELAKLEKIDSNKWSYNEGSLKGHLENRDNKDNKDSKENNKENDLVKKELLKHNLRTDNESMYNKDYQLARAIDLLLGISFYNLEKK